MKNRVDQAINPAQNRARKRILMLAYACSPYRGSEPGTGWQRAVENAKYFDTWVICEQIEFEMDIRRFIRQFGRIPGLSFCFVPKSRFENRLGHIPGLYYVAYRSWHRRAYRAAVRLHRRFRFDLVHQANMCGFREPGFLWKLPVPFVWGPIGGSQNYPWRFLFRAGWTGAVREFSRSIANQVQLRFSRTVRKAARRSAVMMAANSENRIDFERVHGITPELFLEIGVQSVEHQPPNKSGEDGLKLLWSGQFKHHKALHLLIEGLAQTPDSVSYELRILGKGPLESRWRKMARNQGIEANCRWLGWLPLGEAMAQYEWADLFVFTSLRDTAGTVVLEALSRGVPVICLDHQGAGDVVTSDCGVKIPVTNPEQVARDFACTISDLACDPSRLDKLSGAAVNRAEEFLWDRQGRRLADVYHRVLEDSSRSGSFPQEPRVATESQTTCKQAIGERW